MCSNHFGKLTVDDLLKVDAANLADSEVGEWLLALDRARSALEAVQLRAAAAFDARVAYAADGAPSAPSWLAARADVSRSQAAALVRHGRMLRSHPLSDDACATLGTTKVRTVLRFVNPRVTEAFDRDEAMLLEVVAPLSVDQTATVMRHWVCRVDADGAEPRVAEPSEVRLRQGFGGRWHLDGDLEVTDGAQLHAALASHAERLYRREAASADGVQSTAAQRMGRALVDLVARAAGLDASVDTRTPPVVSVIIDLDALTGHDPDAEADIVGAGPIAVETARRLACDSRIGRVICRGRSEILDLGRLERTVTPAQRRALVIRDQGRVFTGCTAPPGWCEAHHLKPWDHGGHTNLDQLGLLCSHHHHLVHEGRYRIQRNPDRQGFGCYRPDGTPITITRLAA